MSNNESGLLQSGEPPTSPKPESEASNPKGQEWKQEFLSKPSISIRKGIAFGHEQPVEFTSTLVLTAPSGKFVDIRFPRLIEYSESGVRKTLRQHSSFWAFTGNSETTFYETDGLSRPGLPFTAHTKFHHVIDSKGPGILDEGDCFLLPNGDVMEVGIWHQTGQLYKEVWTGPSLLPGRTSVLKRPIVVVETTKQSYGQGIIIRVGDHIQGIFSATGDPLQPANKARFRVERCILGTDMAMELQKPDYDLKKIYAKSRDGRGNDEDNKYLPCSRFVSVTASMAPGTKHVLTFGNGSMMTEWVITELER